MLYLVATPIGNLGDLTFRALDVLKRVDLILCEDTRRTKILNGHYGITTPLESFHKFSEEQKEGKVLARLQEGGEIALVSDAGTPTISDPGAKLVARCHDRGIGVTSLPGPCAPIAALTLAGFGQSRFQFLGFLPKKERERKRLLTDSLFYQGVSIFFESPQRIALTLQELKKIAPTHRLILVREMTKTFEECLIGTASELLNKKLRGEIVLLIEGKRTLKEGLSLKDLCQELAAEFDLNKHEAIKLTAELSGLSKKRVYSCLISD